MKIIVRYKAGESIKRADIRGLSQEELRELKYLVDKDICDIAVQISKAQANLFASGDHADPVWFHKAKSAKRIKGQLSQLIQLEMGGRKESEKTFVKSLLQAMDSVLTEGQKAKVLAVARDLRMEWEGQSSS